MRARSLLALALSGVVVVACSEQPPTASSDGPAFNGGRGPVVNFVSVGSDDLCKPDFAAGCDANASLVARKYADGSVAGEWHDNLKFGFDKVWKIHIKIDCLFVDGNQAWVSGVVTDGPFTGAPAIERVADNGTSANEPADQYSFIRLSYTTCEQAPPYELFDMIDGQVKVW
ncbi:MAG TPA: hypothetical protein VK845_08615 [Gemmatimonadales bacterium]|nr:hypothetical protein [Gemmatimonadales bacterium]